MIDTATLELRIIELAMRGKLTHQNTGEQADSFFDEIVSLRDKYQKEGIIAKVKPMEDIKEEEKMFSIPNNWKWVRINEVLDVVMGQSPQGTSVSSDFDGMEFHQGKIYFTEKYLNDSKQRTCEITKIAKANSVLLCVRAPVGVANIVEREICIGRGLCAISSYSDIDPLFVFYYLKICKKQFEMQGTGSTFSAITVDTVKKQLIPLPPKEEMTRIVDVLEKAFALSKTIDNAQHRYSSDLEILKSKIIDAGIQGKLTKQLPQDGTAEELLKQIVDCQNNMIKASKIKKPKDIKNIDIEDIPFEIPNTWKWEKWGNIINVVSARRVHQSDWRKEGIPFYRAREIAKLAVDGSVENDLFISQELYDEFSRDRVPQPGDLMVSAVGTLGKSYVVKDGDLFYYKDASVLCFENYGGMNPYYLRYVMQSSLMKNQIESNSGGTTVDTLTMVRMVQYILPIPPLNEQDRIVSKINEILEIL